MRMHQNSIWSSRIPKISIIIPNYNRLLEIKRAIQSVLRQSYTDFELIIVDDGSTSNLIYDYYNELIKQCEYPLLLILKENGGVHTARNVGAQYSRGDFIIFLDSDDELLPSCLEIFISEFLNIPEPLKNEVFELRGLCLTNGTLLESYKNITTDFNSASKSKNFKYSNSIKPEMTTFLVAKIFKEFYFPEPEGITFVSEDILWRNMRILYRTWVIKQPVRNYHYNETDDSLTNVKRKSIQHCKNRLWNYSYYLNHPSIFVDSLKKMIEFSYIYAFFERILKKRGLSDFASDNKAKNIFIVFVKVFFFPLLVVKTKNYEKKMDS